MPTEDRPETIHPGCYLDNVWGIYNIPRLILMACAHYDTYFFWGSGTEPEIMPTINPEAGEVYAKADRAWGACASPNHGNEDLIDEELQEEAEQAIRYLNQFAPEGFYFGTNDSGDYGVWPIED